MNEDKLERVAGLCIAIMFCIITVVVAIGCTFCGVWLIKQIVEML